MKRLTIVASAFEFRDDQLLQVFQLQPRPGLFLKEIGSTKAPEEIESLHKNRDTPVTVYSSGPFATARALMFSALPPQCVETIVGIIKFSHKWDQEDLQLLKSWVYQNGVKELAILGATSQELNYQDIFDKLALATNTLVRWFHDGKDWVDLYRDGGWHDITEIHL